MVMLEEGVHPLDFLGREGLEDEEPVVALVELRTGLARRIVRYRLGPGDNRISQTCGSLRAGRAYC